MLKNKTEICILGYSNVFKMSFYSFELCGSVPLKKIRKETLPTEKNGFHPS